MRVWMLAFLAPIMLFGIFLATRILEALDEDAEEGRKLVEAGDDELMKSIVTGWAEKNKGGSK
jgi:hypothetical protein